MSNNKLKVYFKNTYVYKTIDTCQLYADVYRSHLNDKDKKPAILWIHGGGLVFGSRRMISEEQINFYIQAGFIIISIDYRLAPETKLDAIITDVQDAYQWICKEGPTFNIDSDNLVIIGHSAGAYLALLAGCLVTPSPRALVSFYGYGDLKWYFEASQHYLKENPMVSKETAYQGVGNTIISESDFTGFTDKRWLFYLYCRQQGTWINEVTGLEPQNINAILESFCPINHITNDYPPTLLLHGKLDTDVPSKLSQQMAEALKQKNIPNHIIILDKLGHMFDVLPDPSIEGTPAGLKHPEIKEVFNEVKRFLKTYLVK